MRVLDSGETFFDECCYCKRRGCLVLEAPEAKGELGRKDTIRAASSRKNGPVPWFSCFTGLWSDLNDQSRESSLKESFAICDFFLFFSV